MSEELIATLLCVLNTIKRAFTEEGSVWRIIFLPTVFAGFGAFSGGYFAYRFRKKEEAYKKARDKLDKMALAGALAAGVCGSALTTKKQLVADAVSRYEESRKKVLSELCIPTDGPKKLPLDLNLIYFSPPAVEVKEVLDAVKVIGSGDPRNMPQAIALLESANNFGKLCEDRNLWIDNFRTLSKKMSDYEIMCSYYGVPVSDREIDSRYRDCMRELLISIDAMIFHSFEIYCRLTCDLVDLSQAFEDRYRERYRFAVVDFSDQVSAGFFPDRVEFADWLREPTQHDRRKGQKMADFVLERKSSIRAGYCG